MLRIGFATRFFTLWDVKTSREWKSVDGFNLPFDRITFKFLKNLSTNEKEAKRKAYLNGVENFEVDHDLNGRKIDLIGKKKSFTRIASDRSLFFESGKYKDQLISNCTDPDYLFFYYLESNNIHAKNKLIEFGFVEYKGQILHKEHFKKTRLRNLAFKELVEKTKIKTFIISNLNDRNEFTFEFKNEVFHGVFIGRSVRRIYKGFEYYFPIINNKPKRVKNKFLQLIFEEVEGEIFKTKIIY